MNRETSRVRATRLGWATRERAELELKRLAGPASWALVWPDGFARGRFGTISKHEQRWA